MFDGILFDLDGTLWDILPQIAHAWSLGLEEFGSPRPPVTAEELRPCMGLVLEDIGERLLPGLPPEEQYRIMGRCGEIEMDYLATHKSQPYPEVEETLALLSGTYPLFVVSNGQDGYIQVFFKGTGLGRYFTDFESAGRTGLPKSENIKLVAARHGLKKPLYVGDTALDASSARKAGAAFLHAAYGFGTVEGEPSIGSFGALPAALKTLESMT